MLLKNLGIFGEYFPITKYAEKPMRMMFVVVYLNRCCLPHKTTHFLPNLMNNINLKCKQMTFFL